MHEPLTLWRPEVRPYQRATLERHKAMLGSALYLDMGLGKTLVAISLFEYWHSEGQRRMIYLCQNSLLQTMADEFEKWNSPLKVLVCPKGHRDKRVAALNTAWDVLIVNYEAIRSLWPDIVRMRPQVLAVDEAQNVKHRMAKQTKAARKLAEATVILGGHRLLMSGTPITKDIRDLWSEVDVMEPSKLPLSHALGFGAYKSYELAVATLTPHPHIRGVNLVKFRPEVVERVTERMSKFATVLYSKDVLPELPSQTFQRVRMTMGDEQTRIYKAMKQDMIAVLNSDAIPEAAQELLTRYGIKRLTIDDVTVVSNLATTLQLRLQQITSGFIKTESGHEVSIPSIKLEWMEDALPQLTEVDGDHKVVIFCRFIHDVQALIDLFAKMDIGVVRLDGQTTKENKVTDNVRAFQTDPKIRGLVANIQVGGIGHTMTAADSAIFYSHSHRYDFRTQAIKRIHRIGQTRPVTYRDLIAAAVDEQVLQSAANKEVAAVTTLDQLRALVNLL